MAITERIVQNKRNSQGVLTSRTGTVYDVNIKYRKDGKQKTLAKRGFATKKEAELYEAEMRLKLQNPVYAAALHPEGKQKLKDYLPKWYESYQGNLSKSTRYSYACDINLHIIPILGDVHLNELTPAMIDGMIQKLKEKDLAENSVRYCERVLSSALSSAVKYGYIQNNPAKNIIYRFRKNAGRKYDKYTIPQVQQLMVYARGNEIENIILLSVLYGLRLSEALGLRWKDIDLEKRLIVLHGQIRFDLLPTDHYMGELDPLKDREKGEFRAFPISEESVSIFRRIKKQQEEQRRLCELSGTPYYDNDLICCKPDGTPYLTKRVSNKFATFLRRTNLPHIRFHDLRGTAGTNMYNLSGDYYTVSEILGHSVDNFAQQMGVNLKINTVTTRYVQVQEQRKLEVLSRYHRALLGTGSTE